MDIDPDNVGDLQKDTARRLKLTRSALGVDQETLGREAGLSQPRYNQYEQDRLLTLKAALMLCGRYALTLDWLYRGDPSGLPYKLANDILRLRRQRAE